MKKESRKKIGSLLIAGTIVVSGIGIDKNGSNKIKEYVGPMEVLASEYYDENAIGVYINNERTEFDVEPSIINDRVMVPMRKIFESLGSTINYNGDTKTITGITEEGHKLEHVIGTNKIKIDNKTLEFDTSSLIKNDRTLVPIRFVGESLGADVYYWDEGGCLPIEPYTYKDIPKKSVDIIKDSDKLNSKKHSDIKESLNVNTKLTQSEKNFFINEMETFYKCCAKYLKNEIIEEKKDLSISYTSDRQIDGSYGYNVITYYKSQSFEEKLAIPDGKETISHEYFHALHAKDITGYLYNYSGFLHIIKEGGAAAFENEFFDGHSYTVERLIIKILCEILEPDIIGNLIIGGNFRVFKAELQKYLGTTEEVNKFCKIVNNIGSELINRKEFDQNNLNEFYKNLKKIYETKYGMEIENDKLVSLYLDDMMSTNSLNIESKYPDKQLFIGDIENAIYFNSSNNLDYYKIGICECIPGDYSTYSYWNFEIPKSERYIDKSKVKKLIK